MLKIMINTQKRREALAMHDTLELHLNPMLSIAHAGAMFHSRAGRAKFQSHERCLTIFSIARAWRKKFFKIKILI